VSNEASRQRIDDFEIEKNYAGSLHNPRIIHAGSRRADQAKQDHAPPPTGSLRSCIHSPLPDTRPTRYLTKTQENVSQSASQTRAPKRQVQRNHNVVTAKAILTHLARLKAPDRSLDMHVESCPKCNKAGYLVREYRRIRGKRYGPYLAVNHYVSKSQSGHTRIRRCYISLKKLAPNEKTRICNLLAASRVSARARIANYEPFQREGRTILDHGDVS